MWATSALARSSAAALLVGLAFAATGCVEVAVREAREPFDYSAVPPEPAPGPTEGAIWPGNVPSGSFLFFDRKARGRGDLVTVRIVERVSATGDATTDVESKSSISTNLTSDVGFQSLVAKPISGLLGLLGLGDDRDVAPGSTLNVLEAENQSTFEGDGSTSRNGSFNAVLTCRVVDVLPGNVFHLRGRRAIVVNHELQYLTVEGLVRQEDIGIDNTVLSTALAEARITLDGMGVIDDRQRPGPLARVLTWIYPF